MFVTKNREVSILLLLFFFIGLVLRGALVGYVESHPERYIQADAIGYDQLAINLVSRHGFSMEPGSPYSPDNFRTPVYPLTIAFFYAIFGHAPQLVLWLQVLMGSFTILITYYLGKQIYGQIAGLIAAGLFAISPHSITYTALLWSDTEYTLIFMLSIIICISILADTQLKWVLLGGSTSALAVLIHPRTIYLSILFTLILIGAMLLRRETIKKILLNASAFIIVFSLVLLPWRLRNYVTFGVPNITSAGGINMLDYGAALTESARTGENQWSIANRYEAEIRDARPGLNAAEFGNVAFKDGVKKILANPLTYAKVHIIGMAKIFLPGSSQIATLITGENCLDITQIYSLFNPSQNLQENATIHLSTKYSTIVWFYLGFEVFYLCLVYFFSLYSSIKQVRSVPWVWLIIITLIYLAAVVGPAGAPRFRVVMMPLISVLAGGGIASLDWVARKLKQS
jgi:4-amino-4-deoxy-L-arabinose transferase-like glycosyltransferase